MGEAASQAKMEKRISLESFLGGCCSVANCVLNSFFGIKPVTSATGCLLIEANGKKPQHSPTESIALRPGAGTVLSLP